MKPYMRLSCDKTLKKKVAIHAEDVVVEDVLMLFSSDAGNSINGLIPKTTPMAYIPRLADFTINYLDRVSRSVYIFLFCGKGGGEQDYHIVLVAFREYYHYAFK